MNVWVHFLHSEIQAPNQANQLRIIYRSWKFRLSFLKAFVVLWGQRVIGISGALIWSKPWWNWYLTPAVNFGEARRAQLAKSILLTSTLLPLGSFKVCSDAKEKVACGKQRKLPHLSIPNKTADRFLSLRWKTCLEQNCSLGSSVCSKGPALGQNNLLMIMVFSMCTVFWSNVWGAIPVTWIGVQSDDPLQICSSTAILRVFVKYIWKTYMRK